MTETMTVCVCGEPAIGHLAFTKCPYQDGFYRPRRPGRPTRPFKCMECGEVLGLAAVRSHKCEKAGK